MVFTRAVVRGFPSEHKSLHAWRGVVIIKDVFKGFIEVREERWVKESQLMLFLLRQHPYPDQQKKLSHYFIFLFLR